MSHEAALPRQGAADPRSSLIEEILLDWLLAGESLPRSPRRRPARPLLERPLVISRDDLDAEWELAMPLRRAA